MNKAHMVDKSDISRHAARNVAGSSAALSKSERRMTEMDVQY
jgi:hypothetical protein